jgi:hypothetical protein
VWDLEVQTEYWPDAVPSPTPQLLSTQWVTRRFRIQIDHTAPSAPTGLGVVGGSGWRGENRFDVEWTKPADVGTPITAVEYRICRASSPASAGPGCVRGVGGTADSGAITGISVPGTGIWRLDVALRDEMGQIDLDKGASTELRLDVDAPRLAFLPRDPADPARVQMSVNDAGSGVASVAIEVRRRGEETWRTLSVSANEGRLTVLLDDDQLPAGAYEVRGYAIDAVGNERTVALGGSALVQLPVRQGSKLSVGRPKRTKRGLRLDPRPSVPFGARVSIRGQVEDAYGKGRANVPVEVSERVALPGVEWRPLITLRTDENGSFSYTAPKGMARTIRFQYAGTPTTRAAGSEVVLRVRAASTLRPSRRSLRNGDSVVLSGRLLGRPIPSSGKLVTVQAWTSRGWLTFGTARARAKDGKWRYGYTFTGTASTVRYRFRAVVTREEAYPYSTGASPVRAVLVHGAG